MNSLSRNVFDNSRKIHREKEVALLCGNAGSGTLTLTTVTPATSITISSLVVNADDFEDPIVKLEFVSNLTETAFSGTVNVQIVKLCTSQTVAIPVGPQFTISLATATTETEPISFFVCDCANACFTGCCVYSVVVTSILGTSGTIAFNAATLSALIVGNHGPCC
jgi:hypothetical protein